MSRLATVGDIPVIMRALWQMLEYSTAPQMKYADPIEAELSIRHAIHEERAYIHAGYFIMVDSGREWYSASKFLIEQIILKVETTEAPVEQAIDYLQVIAKHRGCRLVAAGDTQCGYMAPKYLSQGFTLLGTQFIKELPNGFRQEDHRCPVPD